MIPAIVIVVYLAIIAYIGSVAFRRGKDNTEDFFLAGRSIGPMVFFLSLFATNMTAFAILGSSGAAYKQGIGIFGMMASSSGLVIPLSIFFIGTRLWALGKRLGHMTQVQFFRDRWECSGIGTFIFALSAAMLVPYMIISIIGGGTVLNEISVNGPSGESLISYPVGCAIVAIVVTVNVFFGGMRGVVWVNVFQTILFLLFGAVAVGVIGSHVDGGFGTALQKMLANPAQAGLLTRERMPPQIFASYMLIPLSSIMFPHMSIMCLSAQKMTAFKRTVVLYPLAIMAIWLPCVFLGALGASLVPGLVGPQTDGVLLQLLSKYAPVWLAGLLGAGIISAVMGSDCHQVLALSTMFTKDVFDYYGGRDKYGEKGSVHFARAFIVVVTVAAFLIALQKPEGIFELAIRFAFSGFAALAPVMIAALFWKRSTKWGALAAAVWVAACVIGSGIIQQNFKQGETVLSLGGTPVLTMSKAPVPKRKPGGPGGPGGPRGAAGPGAGAMANGSPGAPGLSAGLAEGSAAGGVHPGEPSAKMSGTPAEGAGNGPKPGAAAGAADTATANGPAVGAGGAPHAAAVAEPGAAGGGGPHGGPAGPAGGGVEPGGPGAGAPHAGQGGAEAGGGPGGEGKPKAPPFTPQLLFFGFMTVVPMVLGSAIFMILVSLLTPAPSAKTIARYFPAKGENGGAV